MKIQVSFDYELFFGNYSGTAEKCLLKPTERLMEIAQRHHVPFIFFVDAGYLVQLKKYLHFDECKTIYTKIAEQLRELVQQGHEIALHIHPHWEDCRYENGKWTIVTKRYKLADFKDEEVNRIVSEYHHTLIEITGKVCKSYRAGGWCIQPFAPIKKALEENQIFIDSTVYHNGLHDSKAHAYDFTLAPDKEEWNFDEDPCIENTNGQFLEIPTTADRIPPQFYWKMYFKMRTNPARYKPVGDGNWLSDKKRIYKQFHSFTNHFACCDGFFASRLQPILKRQERKKKNRMMILGHPKSMANYSFQTLDEFIKTTVNKGHTFTTLA